MLVFYTTNLYFDKYEFLEDLCLSKTSSSLLIDFLKTILKSFIFNGSLLYLNI